MANLSSTTLTQLAIASPGDESVNMSPPPSSQAPLSFHPSFDRDVFTVVFKVEDQGFKIDAMRLTAHAKFLKDMLFASCGHIGEWDEGLVNNPIVVEGCSPEAFANFLGWLNHNSWSPLEATHIKQLVDILHISHMWDILPGIQYTSKELLTFDMSPAQCLYLALRYNLVDWVPNIVRVLLRLPLALLTSADLDFIGFQFYCVIATAKESIESERKHLGNYPPLPRSFEDAPFCAPAQHAICKKVWCEKWFIVILHRIHHTADPLPLSMVLATLREMEYKRMNPECKAHIVNWLCDSCDHVQNEENLIRAMVTWIADFVASRM